MFSSDTARLPRAAAAGLPSWQRRIARHIKIGVVWLIELVVIFIVAEALSVFFLPPAPTFYHPQKLLEPSARRIYDYRPNQRAFTMDKPFVTNSMGFRDEREVPADKNGEFRILSLGDSMAEGLGVAAEDAYARQLEGLLSHRYGAVRVINAGVGSYATWQEVDRLEDKGLSVQPDVVLLAFFWNDLYVRPRTVTPLPISQAGEHRDAVQRYVRWLKRSRVLSWLHERLEIVWLKAIPSFDWTHQQMIYEGRTNGYVEQAYRDVATSLQEFRSLADAHHFVPILIVLPMPGQARRADALTHMQRRMEAIATRIGLPIIDPLPMMQAAYAAKRDLYIPWDNTHLTAQGHRLIADLLEQYLLEHRLVTPAVAGSARVLAP